MVILQELDAFQDLITLPSQPGQLTDKDHINVVVKTEGEGFLEKGPVLVGLPPRDMLFIDLDHCDAIDACIVLQVFHLSLGVLSILKGSLAAASGEDDCCLHKCYRVLGVINIVWERALIQGITAQCHLFDNDLNRMGLRTDLKGL